MRSTLSLFVLFLVLTGLSAPARSQEEEEESFTVGEIVVRARRISNVEQAGTTDVLTAEDLTRRGAKTLDDALEMLPGIQLYTHTKGHRRLRLRGFEQEKVLILIDGVPLNDVFATDVDLSSIPVVNVSKIVVNRGVSSALYGTDGAVGSVNVITRRPRRIFAEGSAEYGLYNNSTYSLAHGMPVKDFYYWINGTVQTSDGYAPSARLNGKTRRRWFDRLIRYDVYGKDFDDILFPAKDQYIEDTGRWIHQGLNRYSASAKAGYRLASAFEAGVSVGFQFQEGRTNTYQANGLSDYNMAQEKWRLNRRPWFGDEVESTKDFALRNRAFVWPAAWRITTAPYLTGEWEAFRFKLSGFFSHAHHVQKGYASADHAYVKDQASIFDDRREDPWEPFVDLKTYESGGLRFVPSYRFAAWNTLSGSIHWRYDSLFQQDRALSANTSPTIVALQGTTPYPVNDLGIHYLSVALEDELRFFDRLKIAVGVSYDAQFVTRFKLRDGEDYGEVYIVKDSSMIMGTRDAFNPVVGIVYDPVKRLLRLRAAGSIKSRFPNPNEYSRITDESLDQQLKPERSYNANAGFELFFVDKRVRLRADYFISVVDDRIEKINKDDPPVNIERVTTQGTEVIASAAFDRVGGVIDIGGSIGYTFLHARNHDNSPEDSVNMGDYVQYLPKHQVTADLRLELKWGTSLSFWGRYDQGARLYVMAAAPEEFSPYSTDFFTTARLHDPVILNLRIAHAFLDRFEVWITARNLLDDYEMDPFNPGMGRMFYFGAKAWW